MSERHQRSIARLLGWVVPLALLALTALRPIVLWSRLPEPIADHWSFGTGAQRLGA